MASTIGGTRVPRLPRLAIEALRTIAGLDVLAIKGTPDPAIVVSLQANTKR
ncbi:MAG: hypothetical protein AAF191_15565 [Verrucomicrobiota bacterium]